MDEFNFTETGLSEFLEKCNTIKAKNCLHTYFGPRTQYKVLKVGKIKYTFFRKDHMFTARWEELGTFQNNKQLEGILRKYPESYARNVYYCENKHWTNWINLLQSFKLKPLTEIE